MNHTDITVKTTCPYCGVGCGVEVTRTTSGQLRVAGDPEHPSSQGRLCAKGRYLGDTLGSEGRLLDPEIDGRPVSWEHALDHVAQRFKSAVEQYGPESVAMYLSGQMLTEDYYVANKLMKGFIGSPHVDTNSRLCMSSTVVGHQRAFGEDLVPGCYDDIEQADLVVLAGSNAAWCHPVLFQRLREARGQRGAGPTVVVIDPRCTASCDFADLHLALRPGTDVVLFNGLLVHLMQQQMLDTAFIAQHTNGFEAALKEAQRTAPDLAAVANQCGLETTQVERFYSFFARTPRTVTLFSQGINQSTAGADKVNALINCHLATGRIGKPGAGPFSLTGQTNAMGGREVGGLATQLAAHMKLDSAADRERVARFWRAPRMVTGPGHKAVELFRAVGRGEIKALWIVSTNPAVSLPDADRVREALRRCEFVVVSECARSTDTSVCAHVRLPAATWGEKDGTVTNSERRIARQRPFVAAPGEARPDWWMITQVAQRMGFGDAFAYRRPAEIFREHAALSGFENRGERLFDISAMVQLDDAAYDALRPIQWPVRNGCETGTARLAVDGQFPTNDGKACFIAVRARGPAHTTDGDYPLVLNTGRIRDQWHTLSRTGLVAALSSHSPEPYVQIHPDDAREYGVEAGGLAQVGSRWGRVLVRAEVSTDQRRGSLFVPMHWNGEYASWARIDAVVNPATDGVSGQPESKHTPVWIKPHRPRWRGFVVAPKPLHMRGIDYWVRTRRGAGWVYRIGGDQPTGGWQAWLHSIGGAGGEWLQFQDVAHRRYRAACVRDGRFVLGLYLGVEAAPAWEDRLVALLEQNALEPQQRVALVAGFGATDGRMVDRTVCSCHGIGERAIREAIATQGLDSPEAIGRALGAGTGCGSCVSELRNLIADTCTSDAA